MVRTLLTVITGLILSACSRSSLDSGWVDKESTNNGLVCQKNDILRAKAIYGADNRLDWFESPGLTKDYWAKATLALIPKPSLPFKDGVYALFAMTYQQRMNLCPGQPFAEQPTAAVCSGFLVAPNLVVTAGHCVRDQDECENHYFVFDYAKKEKQQSEYFFMESEVYQCKKIIKREQGVADYAIIELDRSVETRVPLNIRRQGAIGRGDQVMLIGHPVGLPSKIADGGFVQSVGDRITATVDAFLANSGSAVINSQTGLVEGLLVAGEPDYKMVDGCRMEVFCDDQCRGESITPISVILPFINDTVYDNPICE